MTRGFSTLLGAAVAGVLLWIATQIDNSTTGGYWAVYAIVAAAGLTMALSQLLGGWTKWGWPQISGKVFLIGFLPVLVVALWVVVASQPDPNWIRDHVQSWSGSLGFRDVVFTVNDLLGAIAFGVGLVFGFTFDTTGPRIARPVAERVERVERPVAEEPVTEERVVSEPAAADIDEPVVAERTEVGEGDPPVASTDGERVPSRE